CGPHTVPTYSSLRSLHGALPIWLSVQFNLPWLVLLGFASVPFGTVALVVFLLANAFVVVRREGLSLAHLLPAFLALGIIAICVGDRKSTRLTPVTFRSRLPSSAC